MAKAANGPLGPINGKIGNLVCYMLNGQPVIRTIGDPGKPSRDQLANRQAMSVTMKMVGAISKFTDLSFALEAKGTVRNTHNLATSYIKKQALKGEYPNISIDYSKVILSNGALPVATGLKMEKKDNAVELSWDHQGHDNTIVMVMLYHPLRNRATVDVNACRKDAGSCIIQLHDGYIDEPIEAYLCFRSADGKSTSNSTYIGNLNGEMESEQQATQRKKYSALKERFDLVEAQYSLQMEQNRGMPLDSKAFRNLQKEYEMLRNKLENLPGKPV